MPGAPSYRTGAHAAVATFRLTKRFGAKVAIDDLTLTVAPGTAFGLVGPNGAGKTTTFSVLAGYLRPTEGRARVLGVEPAAVDELRSRVGVLPQDALLPESDTVGEFLVHLARLQDLPGDKALASARERLDEVGGLSWWDQRCRSLSHGMAKRVALAQALLGQPELLLLDEPTAGLDPRVAFEVRALIKARRGRSTIVISSHNLHEIEEICDSAAILDRGKLAAAGTLLELTAANEQVRVQLAPGTGRGASPGQVPLARLRDLPRLTSLELDEGCSELVVSFDPRSTDAETVIGQVLLILLQNEVRVSGVAKGRGLERRVMDVT